jgi:hypothetical protein
VAPVLAIVARTVDADSPLIPGGEIPQPIVAGPTGSQFSLRSRDDDRQKAVAEPEGKKGMGAEVAIG